MLTEPSLSEAVALMVICAGATNVELSAGLVMLAVGELFPFCAKALIARPARAGNMITPAVVTSNIENIRPRQPTYRKRRALGRSVFPLGSGNPRKVRSKL